MAAAGNTRGSSYKEVTSRAAWKLEEDQKLEEYVLKHGAKRWNKIAEKAGLNRSGKSCRLRWLNYLKPGIKRGNMSEDEEDLIKRLHKLLGNRWSLIAGRLPGRTDNEIKNYWNFHLKTRVLGETETYNIPSKHKTSRTSYYEKEPTTSGNNNHECHAGNPNANQIDNECQAAGNLNANQINEADNCFDWSPHISDCSEWVNRLLDLDVEQWLQEDMDILN